MEILTCRIAEYALRSNTHVFGGPQAPHWQLHMPRPYIPGDPADADIIPSSLILKSTHLHIEQQTIDSTSGTIKGKAASNGLLTTRPPQGSLEAVPRFLHMPSISKYNSPNAPLIETPAPYKVDPIAKHSFQQQRCSISCPSNKSYTSTTS
jgi:hypothetical protein